MTSDEQSRDVFPTLYLRIGGEIVTMRVAKMLLNINLIQGMEIPKLVIKIS